MLGSCPQNKRWKLSKPHYSLKDHWNQRMHDKTYFQNRYTSLAPTGQDGMKKLAAMVPMSGSDTGLVRLRTKTSSDSLGEYATPRRKLPFTPTPPSTGSSSFLDSSYSLWLDLSWAVCFEYAWLSWTLIESKNPGWKGHTQASVLLGFNLEFHQGFHYQVFVFKRCARGWTSKVLLVL